MTPDNNEEPRPDDDVDDAGDDLLAHLRDLAAAADPVPEEVTLAARSAIAHLHLDAELAKLTSDSLDEDKELTGVRSTGRMEARQVLFETDEHAIDIEVVLDGGTMRIIGQCSPATILTVVLRSTDAFEELTTDELGRFRAELPGSRLRVEATWPGAERPVVTEWLTF